MDIQHKILIHRSDLARAGPGSGLFRSATQRLAEHALFDLKDVLNGAGADGAPEGSVGPKAWYIEVQEDELERELAFLSAEFYGREVRPPMPDRCLRPLLRAVRLREPCAPASTRRIERSSTLSRHQAAPQLETQCVHQAKLVALDRVAIQVGATMLEEQAGPEL